MYWDIAFRVRLSHNVNGSPIAIGVVCKMWTYFNTTGEPYDIVWNELHFSFAQLASMTREEFLHELCERAHAWASMHTPGIRPGEVAYRYSSCATRPRRATMVIRHDVEYYGVGYIFGLVPENAGV